MVRAGLTRRAVLARTAVAAAGCLTAAGCSADEKAGPRQTEALEYAPRSRAVVTAYDLDVTGRDEVERVLKALAGRNAGGAEIIVGLGASAFAKAGLDSRRPRQLTEMPVFAGDVPDPARSHGDVLVQAGAGSSADARAALAAVDGLSERWRVEGFRDGEKVENGRALARNLFGFSEGHGNPDPGTAPGVVHVTAGHGEPAWAIGGTYQVARIIQFATTLWDADPVSEQERIIGRRRDGHWLDGSAAQQQPHFAGDPDGRGTPLDAHTRRARQPDGTAAPMVRRGYSYRGDREQGLIFLAYQRDLERGFAGVQRRLAGEKLGRYVLPVGGGYFFVPPPGRDGAWWGASLFA
jgi:deferrochelatase/peroxidase EfeB